MATSKSTRSHALDLRRTILKTYAQDFLAYTSSWTLEEKGLFVTIAAATAFGPLPNDVKKIGRLIQARPSRLIKAWPHLTRFLRLTPDGWVLSSESPVTAKLISEHRRSLRGWFAQLVAFWGRACVYCGERIERLAIEHIVPKARGGSDDLTNLTLACHSCNSRKGTKTAAEFGHPRVHEQAQQIQ